MKKLQKALSQYEYQFEGRILMSDCQKFEDRFVDALYGELDPSNQQALDEHLKECSRCSELFASLQKTLNIMDGRKHPELPENIGINTINRYKNGWPMRSRKMFDGIHLANFQAGL